MERTKIARKDLKLDCITDGWTAWDINPKTPYPYQIGVNLNEPHNKTNIQCQLTEIAKLANNLATENGLEVAMGEPVQGHGGLSVYVGLSYIKPELQKRFSDYKVLTKAIKKGENERGYRVKAEGQGHAFSCEYDTLDNHLILRWNDSEVIHVFDSGNERDAKKRCYQTVFNYLRKTAIIEGNTFKIRTTNSLWEIFGPDSKYSQMTKYGKLSDGELDRVNHKREKRGLEPVSKWKTDEEMRSDGSLGAKLERGYDLLSEEEKKKCIDVSAEAPKKKNLFSRMCEGLFTMKL